MGLRTIHLKIHNPSSLKKNIINQAFLNYNYAYNFLLRKAFEDINNIEANYKSPKGTYSTLGLSKWVDKDLSAKLNDFDVQPFKDSLKLDIGMTLASYFVQKKTNPAMPFPTIKAEYINMKDKLRPIYFCRYDTKRSFCLLYDYVNDKFFAKLFLMNIKNAKERKSQEFCRGLRYISKDSREVKALKKETFLVLPLSFGSWQKSMLVQAIEKPDILRTAHLILKNNQYYLSLSIDLPEEQKIETKTFLGVCRGIESAVNYSIVNSAGDMLLNCCLNCKSTVSESELKNDINKLANKIVDIAVENKAIVILQNLTGKGDKLSWNDNGKLIRPVFGCKLYNNLVRILEYKLPQKGLPAPAKVSSVDIFHRCSVCGCNTKKNRFSKDMFICTTCGLSSNLDSLGSYNLATKLIKYETNPIKLKRRITLDGIYLHNDLLGLDLFVPQYQNPFETFKEGIKHIFENLEEYTESKGLNRKDVEGIIEKLIKQNFSNLEII